MLGLCSLQGLTSNIKRLRREFPKLLEKCKTRSKQLERDQRISKETREVEEKVQTAPKKLENFRTWSKPLPLERRYRISDEVAKRLDILNQGQSAREGRIKEQAAWKRLEILKQRSRPLKRG